jgi:hypothetical protein
MNASEASDRPLLLELAKDAFARQVARRVRPLARSYVERWLKGEFWLYKSVILENERELRGYAAIVLETLRRTSTKELLDLCRTTRPDLDDLWSDPASKTRLSQEIAGAIEAVEAL